MTYIKKIEIIKHRIIKEMKISEFRDWLYLDMYGNKQNTPNLEDVVSLREFLGKGKYNDHLKYLNAVIE